MGAPGPMELLILGSLCLGGLAVVVVVIVLALSASRRGRDVVPCPQCGAPAPLWAQYCPHCGRPLGPEP